MAGLKNISVFGNAGSLQDRKPNQSESADASPLCPKCSSAKLWRNGQRTSPYGDIIQRWLCRKCGYIFSDPQQLEAHRSMVETLETHLTKPLKTNTERSNTRQICATIPAVGGAKNLEPEQTAINKVPENVKDTKGKLLQYAWTMQQQGYASETIRGNSSCLRALIARGADLADPETIKTVLAKETKWSHNRKRNIINAYTLLLKFDGAT